nr:NADH dehydrogenase subunit 3 [Linognathus africanus]
MLTTLTLSFTLPFLSSFVQGSEEIPIHSLEPFECGIEPMEEARMPMSIHFLMIGVLFLVFDMEVIMIIPSTFIMMSPQLWWLYWLTFSFVMFVGMLVETLFGSIEWKFSI